MEVRRWAMEFYRVIDCWSSKDLKSPQIWSQRSLGKHLLLSVIICIINSKFECVLEELLGRSGVFFVLLRLAEPTPHTH